MARQRVRQTGLPTDYARISHARYSDGGTSDRVFRFVGRLRFCLRANVTETFMLFDYALAGVVTIGLLAYLAYALLRPERF